MRGWTIIRLGAGLTLTVPLAYWVLQYFTGGGTLEALPMVLLAGALQSAIDFVVGAVHDPVRALLYIAVLWLLGRVAFGPSQSGPHM